MGTFIKNIRIWIVFLFTLISIKSYSQCESVVITKQNIDCFGSKTGSITVSGAPGYPGYIYTLLGGPLPLPITASSTSNQYTFSNLAAGTTYFVVIQFILPELNEDGDTTITCAYPSIKITAPTNIVMTGTLIPPKCKGTNDGGVNLNVTGGTPPYSYLWSDGSTNQNLTGVSAGNYSVTITDSKNCKKTASYSVTEPSNFALTGTPISPSCNGGNDGAVNISLSGATPPYTFLWSNGSTSQNLSGVPSGSYSVQITDANGCTQTSSFSITDPSLINVTGSVINTDCNATNNGAVNISVSGGTAPYTFLWSNGATTQNISGVPANTYSVTVTDAKGCSKNSSFTISQPNNAVITPSVTNVKCNGGNDG
ncbi:SprB repeat-containing protein, partial [Sporocytophaga myxococcoides]|uniref:SprB repeat-containing protein n=1 Tax=Sporocytophaga myxococcoides TaxID=153721 RepID=UPI00048DDF13